MSIVPGKLPRKVPPQVEKTVERLLSVQRPVVLLHIHSIRRRNPNASPAQVIKILETRSLTAVTAGGAARCTIIRHMLASVHPLTRLDPALKDGARLQRARRRR